jgi:hypothetical protein
MGEGWGAILFGSPKTINHDRPVTPGQAEPADQEPSELAQFNPAALSVL